MNTLLAYKLVFDSAGGQKSMDKMSVWSILLVSFPEEILVLVTTLAAAGYKDVLNFKRRKNVILFLSALILMVASAVGGRAVLPSATANFFLQALLFYLIIICIYKYRVIACIPSFLLAISVLVIGEAVFGSICLKLLNLTLDDVNSIDLIRVLVTIPIRLSQIAVVVIVCKIRNINVHINKLTTGEWISIITYCITVVLCMISIEVGVRNLNRDFETIIKLLLSVVIAVLFISWMIIKVFGMQKKITINENMHDVELYHVKKLLEEGRTEYAIELIELTLKDRGYYNKQF